MLSLEGGLREEKENIRGVSIDKELMHVSFRIVCSRADLTSQDKASFDLDRDDAWIVGSCRSRLLVVHAGRGI